MKSTHVAHQLSCTHAQCQCAVMATHRTLCTVEQKSDMIKEPNVPSQARWGGTLVYGSGSYAPRKLNKF